jgi:hypothetical protein
MATGENAGTWGQITNTNLYLIQQAIGGYQEVSIAGGAQTTALAMSDGALSNARNAVIKLTGTITGNQVVTIPTGIEKTYIISNGTTGAFTVEFKQAGGTGITFGTTDKSTRILFADGTNIVDTGTVSTSAVQTLTNKTLTSPIINEIDDANSNEQVIFTSTASAVNEFTITNAATANAPEISATGGDTNIDLKITPKGSGKINLDGIKFPNADGSSGQFLRTDGSGSLSFADSGLAWQSVVTTSTITVVAGRAYFINTTSAACTVTLPSGTPTAGAQVQLVDYAGTFDTNALTINPNGNKIEGGTGNLGLTGDCCPSPEGSYLGCCNTTLIGKGYMSDEWKSLIYINSAIINRDNAWNNIMQVNNFGQGGSKSNSLFWTASRSEPISNSLVSNWSRDPHTYVKKECSANTACVALNVVGDCCPNEQGMFLGCCPTVI